MLGRALLPSLKNWRAKMKKFIITVEEVCCEECEGYEGCEGEAMSLESMVDVLSFTGEAMKMLSKTLEKREICSYIYWLDVSKVELNIAEKGKSNFRLLRDAN